MKQVKIILAIALLMLINSTCSDDSSILNTNYTELDLDSNPTDSINQETDSLLTNDWINKQDSDSGSISPTRKCIYLTIDDGPLNGAKYIDSIVNKEQIKTNLFIVGKPIDGSGKFKKSLDMFRQNSRIEIYNHSYTHASNKYTAFYKNADAVLEDFEKNRESFNLSDKIARLPGRNLWLVGNKQKNMKQTGATSAQLMAENGYKIFGWDVEWKYDHKDYVPEQTVDELIEEIDTAYNSNKVFTPQHIVLLMHDQMFAKKNDKNNLGRLVSQLKEKGYTFEYLSSYPEQTPTID